MSFSPLVDTSLAEYQRVVSINQIGTFLGMRECVPLMKRRGGGSIVNVTSVEGLAGMPWMTAYAASKFAIRGMTKVAAAELGMHGVRVNSVNPGAIDPAMAATALGAPVDLGMMGDRVPLGRDAQAEEVANLVLFLASDESSYCTGGEFVADGASAQPVSGPPPTPQRPYAVPPAPVQPVQPSQPPQGPYYGQQEYLQEQYVQDPPWAAEGVRRRAY
jgi:3alpha(or 20beta)-hydroxysteroid dehydrogenase